MSDLIPAVLNSEEKDDFYQFISTVTHQSKRYLLRNEVLQLFNDFFDYHNQSSISRFSSHLQKLINFTQEIIIEDDFLYFVLRPKIGNEEAYCIDLQALTVKAITVSELLDVRDRFMGHYHPQDGSTLALDFHPFYDYSPVIRDPKNIGQGGKYLNRYLSSQLFQEPKQGVATLLAFLQLHSYNGTQLLVNNQIQSEQQLSDAVKQAIAIVSKLPPTQPYEAFRSELQSLGFEPGWGNTAARVLETLDLLDELIDSPDDKGLEAFISRIPMIFKIALVSIHGYFGQEGVLGRPDTGGQVVYVLDQAKNLEQQLQNDLNLAGLQSLGVQPHIIILTRLIPNSDGTLCNQRLERVNGTENTWIVRVPFRDFNPNLTQNWISRFEIWPYLETYAVDAEAVLLEEFQGKPNLIVGNYSDGNLVAFLLARRLGVTQCNIAHALEKSKYLFSDLYWQDSEETYHFSLQFTADLLAMNAANFIITSTYQEIVGRPDSVGQYESYRSFTMPDLYHVLHGVELFSPRFNVVSPGVNEQTYFPYYQAERREPSDTQRLEQLLFTLDDPGQVLGQLDDPNKRPIFSMARLDRIKNLTGLAECFGQSAELQAQFNLILVAGKLRTEDSTDHEEINEIERLYQIIDQYNLHGKFRWLGVRFPTSDAGEVYRVIADRQGVFVQPALFEAFGLTVLESMISGVPTFATCFGGPLEIIQDEVNGFHINPTNHEEMIAKLLHFTQNCDQTPGYWQQISKQSIERVYSSYTWRIHCTRLLTLAKVYSFWDHSSQAHREDMLRYIETLFHLLYKPRAQTLLAQHMQTP